MLTAKNIKGTIFVTNKTSQTFVSFDEKETQTIETLSDLEGNEFARDILDVLIENSTYQINSKTFQSDIHKEKEEKLLIQQNNEGIFEEFNNIRIILLGVLGLATPALSKTKDVILKASKKIIKEAKIKLKAGANYFKNRSTNK